MSQSPWRGQLADGGHVAVQRRYSDLVAAATNVYGYTHGVVPGLLQTRAYAHAVLTEMAHFHGRPGDDVDAAVEARLARQAHLDDPGKHFRLIVDEAVLHRAVYPVSVHTEQLRHLRSLVSQPRGDTLVGVLPLATLTSTPQNGFDVFDGDVYVETYAGETVHKRSEDEAVVYARAFKRLWADAVTGTAAEDLIAAAATRL